MQLRRSIYCMVEGPCTHSGIFFFFLLFMKYKKNEIFGRTSDRYSTKNPKTKKKVRRNRFYWKSFLKPNLRFQIVPISGKHITKKWQFSRVFCRLSKYSSEKRKTQETLPCPAPDLAIFKIAKNNISSLFVAEKNRVFFEPFLHHQHTRKCHVIFVKASKENTSHFPREFSFSFCIYSAVKTLHKRIFRRRKTEFLIRLHRKKNFCFKVIQNFALIFAVICAICTRYPF